MNYIVKALAAVAVGASVRSVMRRGTSLLAALAWFLFLTGSANATGIVLVNNDDWTLSQQGFVDAGTSTTNFVQDISNLFTGGHGGGNFLADVNEGSPALTGDCCIGGFGASGNALQSAFAADGDTWTVSNTVPFTLASLSAYAAIFFTGPTNLSPPGCGLSPSASPCSYPDNQVLIDYVNAGGNVYVGAGLEWDPSNESIVWNTFLNAFGLGYTGGSNYNGVDGLVDVSTFASQSPLFNGVTDLLFDNGDNVTLSNPVNPDAQLFAVGGNALFGLYEPVPSSVPEPSSASLIVLALAGLGVILRRRGRLKMGNIFKTLTTVAIGAMISFTSPSRADVLVGNDLIPRQATDTCSGCVIILPTPFASANLLITNWSFFGESGGDSAFIDRNSDGGSAIPLLLSENGTVFTVVGIGTPRSGEGLQAYSFGLQTGTDVTSDATYFGWEYSNGSSDTLGNIAFSWVGSPIYTNIPAITGPLSVGEEFTAVECGSFCDQRTYSVEVDGVPAPANSSPVPEPWSLLLFSLGLIGLISMRSSRFHVYPPKKDRICNDACAGS